MTKRDGETAEQYEARTKYKLLDRIQLASKQAIDEAYKLGQSVEVTELKVELESAMKRSQEAYEFLKVVLNRVGMVSSDIDSTTVSYIRTAKQELEQIKGIKK